MTLQLIAEERMRVLAAKGLLRSPHVLSSAHGPTATFEYGDAIVLSSNDYLGITGHPRLHDALVAGSTTHGLASAASRLISGTHDTHRAAEAALAQLTHMPSALLFSSGYAANVGILSTLPQEGDVVFSDALNHASIIDGCRLSRASVVVYPHADMNVLEQLLETERPAASHAFIVSDALFSMDGDLAPLVRLRALADEYDASLLVDEAHSLGVLGPGGAGACHLLQIKADLIIGTLGKALGLWGAFAASSSSVCRLLETSARSFVFSTASSPAAAGACVVACELIADADDARARVLALAGRIRRELSQRGWNVPSGQSQIVPVMIGSADATMRVSEALLDNGVFVQGIRPPTVAEGTSRLRVAPMAGHTDEMMDLAMAAFRTVEGLRP